MPVILVPPSVAGIVSSPDVNDPVNPVIIPALWVSVYEGVTPVLTELIVPVQPFVVNALNHAPALDPGIDNVALLGTEVNANTPENSTPAVNVGIVEVNVKLDRAVHP